MKIEIVELSWGSGTGWEQLLQNSAYVTRAQLSCHVQNVLAITSLQLGWQQNEMSIIFKLRRKNRSWNGPNVAHNQMETFSAFLTICAGNSPHKGQWRGALMFSLIYAWINGWVNNREAGELRRHRAHYDVTVMRTSDLISSVFWRICWRIGKTSSSTFNCPTEPGSRTRI